MDLLWRSCSRNVDGHTIQSCLRSKIESFVVFPAPSEIVRMFGANNRAKVLPFRRDDPEAARPREIQIALRVDFHPVPGVFARLFRGVKKDLCIGKCAVGM